jgi:hypothetical protein
MIFIKAHGGETKLRRKKEKEVSVIFYHRNYTNINANIIFLTEAPVVLNAAKPYTSKSHFKTIPDKKLKS